MTDKHPLFRKHDQRFVPGHLNAVSYLYGIETVAPHRARVLELGCGEGDRLYRYAIRHPEAEAMGVDMDPERIAAGIRKAELDKLDNLVLFAASLDELLEQQDLGKFDYIIVTGVFSSLDSNIRGLLLQFCEAHLSDQGIACFEYRTYPGSKNTDILHDALRLQVGMASNELEALAQAQTMLAYLSAATTLVPHSAQEGLREQLKHLRQLPEEDFLLQHVHGLYAPCYFIEFNDLAEQAGLAYVGDADPCSELSQYWSAQLRSVCDTMNPEKNKILGQQYLDFVSNRMFRCSILTKADRKEKIFSEPDLGRLQDLSWAGFFDRIEKGDGLIYHGHNTLNTDAVSTQDSLTLSVLDYLGYAWPLAIDSQALKCHVTQPIELLTDNYEVEQDFQSSLEKIFMQLGDQVHMRLPEGVEPCFTADRLSWLPELPRSIADLMGKQDCKILAVENCWGQSVSLELNLIEITVLSSLLSSKQPLELLLNKQLDVITETDTVLCELLAKCWRYGLLTGGHEALVVLFRFIIATYLENKEQTATYLPHLMLHAALPKGNGLDGEKKQAAVCVTDEVHPEPEHLELIDDLLATDQYDEARQLAEALVKVYSSSDLAWNTLYKIIHMKEMNTEAIYLPAINSVISNPYSTKNYFNISKILRFERRHIVGRRLTEQVVKGNPDHAYAWDQLGFHYEHDKQLHFSYLSIKRAVELQPENLSLLNNLARSYSQQGDSEEALRLYEKIIEKNPKEFSFQNNYLFALLHSPDADPELIFRKHREFGERVEKYAPEAPFSRRTEINRKSDETIRLGFVSGDLRNHPVANFLLPYIENINREKFSMYFYSNSNVYDQVSRKLECFSDKWLQVLDIDDIDLAKIIHDDEIDILFDLSGHTAYNRLPVFALKPAPVQISWMGYPGTTGMREMDYYFISKNIADPGVLDSQFTEELLYLDSDIPFSPPENSPLVSELPFLQGAPFTFGSFNRPQKITDGVLKVWAEILKMIPESRLLLGCMSGDEMKKNFSERLSRYGIENDRVVFQDRTGMKEYLTKHRDVDILLDTFPYPGGTTTILGGWMGVPTLTLAGETLVERVGVVVLRQWGLEGFIAQSPEEYVKLAIQWYQESDKLAELRKEIRSRMNETSTKDRLQSIRNFEDVIGGLVP